MLPTAIIGFAGVTVIELGTSTVRVVIGLVAPPNAAVIPDEPTASAVVNPPVLIVATAGVAEFQVA